MIFTTIDELWEYTISKLLRSDSVGSRVGQTKEFIGYNATLKDINCTFLLNKRRKLSPAYACSEIIWYLRNTKSIEMIKAYAPQYEKFAENGFAHGAYGYRIGSSAKEDQIRLLVEHLKEMPNSRQAIISLWNANDLWHSVRDKKGDLPCTLSLQFLIRNGQLHLINTMRSNDAWLGLPYDIFAFTCIQRLVADVLKIPAGSYTHQVGSMHLYKKNWAAAQESMSLESRPVKQPIKHNWDANIPLRFELDIRRAIACEETFRAYRKTVIFPKNDMLRDIVLCCANKWIKNYYIKPVSEILQDALERTK